MTSTNKSGNGNKQSADTSKVEIQTETTRRLKIGEFSFEETSVNNKGVITMQGPTGKAQELSDDEVGNFVRFFVGFQRRQGRDDSVQDGRGQVTNESTDQRLKENKGGGK